MSCQTLIFLDFFIAKKVNLCIKKSWLLKKSKLVTHSIFEIKYLLIFSFFGFFFVKEQKVQGPYVTTVTIVPTFTTVTTVTTVFTVTNATTLIVWMLLFYSSKGKFFTKVLGQTDRHPDKQTNRKCTSVQATLVQFFPYIE